MHKLTTVLVTIVFCLSIPAAAMEGLSDLEKMRILEQTALTDCDEQLFLLDGQIWIRYKGDYNFRLGESTCAMLDLDCRPGVNRGDCQKSGEEEQYDTVLRVESNQDIEYLSALEANIAPTEKEGIYRSLLTQSQISGISARGIEFTIYPQYPTWYSESDDENGEFIHNTAECKESFDPNEVIFYEGFEGHFPQDNRWVVGDYEGGSGDDYWDDVDFCWSEAGDWSGWCAGIGNMPECVEYDNNMDAYMMSPAIHVEDYDDVFLHWHFSYDTEYDKDYLCRYYSANGQNWTYAGRWTGRGHGWYEVRVSGFVDFYIQFIFDSNWWGSADWEGAYLDEISVSDTPTGIAELPADGTPTKYQLAQNFPNPFNSASEIVFGLPHRSHVKLSIFNLMGQEVAVLVDDRMDAGYHSVACDASNYSSGIYFYKLTAGDFTEIKRMTLLK